MAKRRNLISFVLDRTGSMETIRDATISGFNEFLNGQLTQDYKTFWTLTIFDSVSIDELFSGRKGKDVPKLTRGTYVPRALTPLYDAIAQSIYAADKIADDYDGVIFVVMTDGFENASKEYTHEQLFKLIREREDDKNWQFIYLGANQDAYAVGYGLGIRAGSTVSYAPTDKSVAVTMASAGQTTAAYAATGQTQSTHHDTTSGTVEDDQSNDPMLKLKS